MWVFHREAPPLLTTGPGVAASLRLHHEVEQTHGKDRHDRSIGAGAKGDHGEVHARRLRSGAGGPAATHGL